MMKTFRFDEIAYNSTQKVKPTEADKEHYIGLEHIDGECLYISRWGSDVAPIGEKLVMRKGDILFGKRRAYQRKVAIAPIDGIFSAHGLVLRPKEDVVDKDYFPFFMSSNQFLDRAVQISVGGLSPTINWKDLARQEFTLPSLSEQKVLADKLWAAYRVKESYKKLLAATDDMLKAKFQEMFGEEGDKYSIKDLFELQMGKTPDRQNSLYWTQGKHKWFSIADMSKSEIYSKDTDEYISDLAVEKSGIKKVKKGTIFMRFKLTIGKVLIASEDVYTNEAIMAFNERYPYEAETGLRISKKWIYYTFLYKDWLENAAQAVKGRTLNKESIGNSNIIVPKYELQQQFAEIATQAEATKESLRKSIENIDQVIKSLINQ